jgi:hypothetical protein
MKTPTKTVRLAQQPLLKLQNHGFKKRLAAVGGVTITQHRPGFLCLPFLITHLPAQA